MNTLGHRKDLLCPRCGLKSFCDDCGLCELCSFKLPDVDLPHPPAPAPRLRCDECGSNRSHSRGCSVTRHAAIVGKS